VSIWETNLQVLLASISQASWFPFIKALSVCNAMLHHVLDIVLVNAHTSDRDRGKGLAERVFVVEHA